MYEKGWGRVMKNMFRFQLRRLLRKPSFYVCFGLCLAFTVLVILAQKATFDTMGDLREWLSPDDLQTQFMQTFSPQLLSLNIFGSTMLPLLLAVFSGIYICEDRVRGTIKNIYARGYSRTSVFLSKFIVSTCIACGVYLLTVLIAYLSGMVICATSSYRAAMLTVDGYWLLVLGRMAAVLALNAFYFMLSELIGTTGFSIAANIFAPGFISTIVLAIIGIAALVMQDNTFSSNAMTVYEYWVYNLATSGFEVDMDWWDYIGHLVASVVYFAGFGILGWLIVKKKQVKN